MISRRDLTCPLCSCRAGRDERRLVGFQLVRCTECRFVYVWPRPSRDASRHSYATGAKGGAPAVSADDAASEELMRAYDLEYTSYVRRSLADRLRRVADGRPVQRMLDFGCGSGHFLGLARDVLRCETYGVELNPVGALGARRFGFELHAGPLEDVPFGDASFDLVYASQVFEHLPEPRAELAVLCRLLAPGGRLYVEVPNYGSISIRVGRDRFASNTPPGHVNYFTPWTLRNLVESCGLGVRAVRTTGLNHRALLGRDASQSDPGRTTTDPRTGHERSASVLRSQLLWFIDTVLSIPGWGMQIEIIAERSAA